MTQTLHYSKAPITEAIIDIRVKLASDATVEDIEQIRTVVEAQYPICQKRSLAHGHFEVGQTVSASASSKPIGFFLKSEDERQIIQARLDGFSFSRLKPYESWETFRDEARIRWQQYRDLTKPVEIERLAVRYVNRFDIPKSSVDLKDYFQTSPEISPKLSQTLSGMFMQLQIPQDDLQCHLIINQTIVPPNEENSVSIVMDLDLFSSEQLPNDDEGIWIFFDKLRDRKNEIFEACITEKARELIR